MYLVATITFIAPLNLSQQLRNDVRGTFRDGTMGQLSSMPWTRDNDADRSSCGIEEGSTGERTRGREKGRKEGEEGETRQWTRLMHNSCRCLPRICIFMFKYLNISFAAIPRKRGLGKYSAVYSLRFSSAGEALSIRSFSSPTSPPSFL